MKQEKRIARLLSRPSDYTFTEAEALLKNMGFERSNKGNTSGSRVMFFRQSDGAKITLHKPHPGDIMKRYAINQLIDNLKGRGDI